MECIALGYLNTIKQRVQQSVPPMEIGKIVGEQRIACASGSRESANNRGLRGQPCLVPLDIEKGGEQVLPVSTTAVGFLYSTLIILINDIPNPIHSSSDHRKGHSRRSKAFNASKERTAAGELKFCAPFITCSNLLTLSVANLDLINPVCHCEPALSCNLEAVELVILHMSLNLHSAVKGACNWSTQQDPFPFSEGVKLKPS